MDKIELNLDNPIFVYYICTAHMSNQRAIETVSQAQKIFDCYTNVTVWVIPTEEPSKIKCIYNNKNINLKDKKRIEAFTECKTLEDFQREIRQWRIDSLLD